jgi:hypothetical protein
MGLQANPAHCGRPQVAIYSLHHSPIGKSTQAQPYTAAAHINYITRKRAMSLMQKARLPGQNPHEVAEYLKGCEDRDRKNARVIDKVMLALPKELSQTERIGLVRGFAEHVTLGRAPWLAAFHDKGKDASNPHCHLVIRDRDPKTNKRVIGTSEKGSTEQLRESWEKYANQALERAGRSERVDRRTLAEQGIAREPTIHEGPQSQAMDKRGAKPKSRQRRVRNAPGARRRERDVDYRRIDKGNSRPQVNRLRRAAAQESERDYWDAIDRDSQARELQGLAAIHNPHREHVTPRPAPPAQQATRRADQDAARPQVGKPRQASAKPAEKLAKQKPKFKDQSPASARRRGAAQETERDYWDAIDRDSQARELQDLAAIHNPHKEHAMPRPTPPRRQVAKVRDHDAASANIRKPREASVKPSEKLAKQKLRYKDLGPASGRSDFKLGNDNAKAAASHTAKAAGPSKKLNARDQRALDRMKRERAEDRVRDR